MNESTDDDNVGTSCKYCATIGRFKYRAEMMRGALPNPDEPTATVTFLRFEGQTYAVTAAHAIATFDRLRVDEGREPEGYFCPAGNGVAILGPFLQPPEDFQGRRPDVAICPIHEELPARLGKVAYPISEGRDVGSNTSHAVAVGYPTTSKDDFDDGFGFRLRMRCIHAVAEAVGSSSEGDQLQFFSELNQKPEVGSLSGMSGGAVFGNDEGSFGLIGFVKEALDTSPIEGEESLYDGPRVHFLCQRCDAKVFSEWAGFVTDNWQKERDKLNQEFSAIDE